MKYGMNLLLWTTNVDASHDPLVAKMKEIGYDGVEVPVFDLNPDVYRALGKKLDALGLERTTVTVSTPDANPISPDTGIRAKAVERLKQAVDCTAAGGAKKLCGPFHSALGEFTGKGPTKDEWNHVKDVLAKVADHAQKAGVTLVLEYLNRFECYFLNCVADTARFVREVNHPHLKMMYDTFHANIEEKNIAEAIRSCIAQTVHVHISENDRSTPGDGHVDWKTTFATLKEVGYDGWMVVEAFGLALPDLAAATKIWRKMYASEEDLARRALAFMKKNVEG